MRCVYVAQCFVQLCKMDIIRLQEVRRNIRQSKDFIYIFFAKNYTKSSFNVFLKFVSCIYSAYFRVKLVL